MAIRYMGTKRYLAAQVNALVSESDPHGSVVDLFSGVGAVVEGLANLRPVIANDLLTFTGCLARARFTPAKRLPVNVALEMLTPLYRAHLDRLIRQRRAELRGEAEALTGTWQALRGYMGSVPHAGGSSPTDIQLAVRAAAHADDDTRYQLASLYFAGAYLSVKQAIQVDSLRFAIEQQEPQLHDWLLAAWIAAIGVVVNAPGHAAQYLRSHDEVSAARIRRAWGRNVWDVFRDKLTDLKPVGTPAWRRQNRVISLEARHALATRRKVGLVYADPPYTKDQYSRYYHMYETLYLYDYPESTGMGRYRADRFTSDFSVKTKVAEAFAGLAAEVSRRAVPLILSYPSNGLLSQAGVEPIDLLRDKFASVRRIEIPREHSTMGGRSGMKTKPAMENLYVCV